MAIKIIYTGLQKENYNPHRGFSFEYNNFYLTLKNMKDVEVVEHPFDRIPEVGKKKFNEELYELVEKKKPNLIFAFMYTDELDPEILLRIKQEGKTKTVAWFADDYWRFWNYSKHWPPYFDWVVTTYSKAVEWYRQAGFQNVIRSQWGCNTAVYKPLDIKKDIDVSFVGQYKPQRGSTIRALERAGVNVQTFGFGWPVRHASLGIAGGPNGKVSREEILRIFSRSKINLNLNVRPGFISPRVIARIFLRKSINRLVPDFHLIDNVKAYLHFPTLHTHARPFELAGCRAFVISGYSDDIRAYYKESEEMVFYNSAQDLIQKIKYYLSWDEGRERIAEEGYKRTLRDHAYEKRFQEIFTALGFEQ